MILKSKPMTSKKTDKMILVGKRNEEDFFFFHMEGKIALEWPS